MDSQQYRAHEFNKEYKNSSKYKNLSVQENDNFMLCYFFCVNLFVSIPLAIVFA